MVKFNSNIIAHCCFIGVEFDILALCYHITIITIILPLLYWGNSSGSPNIVVVHFTSKENISPFKSWIT